MGGGGYNRHFLTLLFLCLFLTTFIYAKDNNSSQDTQTHWIDGFFIEGSALFYFAPEMLDEYLDTRPGFRGAIGYEYKNFRFAVESGYSDIIGKNPLVKEIALVPLVFKFGYALPLFSIIGLQADLSVGTKFSNTIRYETALDYITDNLSEDNEKSFLLGARLYAIVLPLSFLKIYAGGGIDVLFETDGPIPLPLLEAGLSIKPFLMARKINNKTKKITVTNGVYFEPNSASIIEEYVTILDEAGQKLKGNSSLRVTLRAYFAPDGKEKQVRYSTGEPALSAARANICAEYLSRNYGIDLSRIKIEHHDAGKNGELYRCVEIIIR